METVPMDGKSLQSNHRPHVEGKNASAPLKKHLGKEGEKGARGIKLKNYVIRFA